jgi:TolB-like protein/DNA-binding winged helix-turn-helix (wHTH) protein
VFEVDLSAGELRKQGIKIKLREQPFQVLRVLLEHSGQVVTREELQRHIWPSETFVDFEHGLYNAIRRLREALGDSAENPRFVETLSKRGYRFIAAADAVNAGSGVAATLPEDSADSFSDGAEVALRTEEPVRRRWRWPVALVTAALATTLLALTAFRVWDRVPRTAAVPRIQSLAVIPLTNLSGDPAQEYFSDGMTDALITDLAQVGSLKVISRTSSMRYKKTDKSLPEITRELNVDGIIEGTVQRSGDRVRITAQLIHGPSDKHIWAKSYERDMRDVFALEADVTGDITRQVQAHLTTPDQASPAPRRRVNLDALEAYLQGNYHLHKGMMADRDRELKTAGEYFQHAIDAAPDFALAYVGLAEAHHYLLWASSVDSVIMIRAAEKAVALDPGSSEARVELGETKYEDWDWPGAEEEFRRAIELNPNNASAHDQLGECLDDVGRLEEAWKEFEIAQELDPNQDHLSGELYIRGDYDRSIELLHKTLESRPEDAVLRWFLAEDYAQKGLYKEWVRELGECFSLLGFPESAGRIEQAFAVSEYTGARRQEAREVERWIVSKQAYMPAFLADVYSLLGDKDRAFYWLRHGIDHHHMDMSDNLQWFKVDPELAPLRSDPRFKDLLRRAGLPP